MKKFLTLSAILCAGAVLSAQPELLLKMDMTKEKDGALVKWNNNWAINKIDRVILEKNGDGAPYLKGRNRIQYYYSDLYAVTPADMIILEVTARGNDSVAPGYHIFAPRSARMTGTCASSCRLGKDWKTYTVKKQIHIGFDRKKNKTLYPDMIRPFVLLRGKGYQFKDYSISIIRNPVLTGWQIDHGLSRGGIKAAEDGSVAFAGHASFFVSKLEKVKAGNKIIFTFRARGKGTLAAGFKLYDLKYHPRRKGATHCGEFSRTEQINSSAWKTITVTGTVDNVTKDGKRLLVNRIRRTFSVKASDGAEIEIKSLSCKIEAEELTMPAI
ncbi:MAG: hypothetical protein IKO93_08865 [Lentisphaeria bacterium]|nr:hypothetical protein [Lentisphaeria bacterium]